MFSKVDQPYYISPAVCELQVLHIFTNTFYQVVLCFNLPCSDGFAVISHGGFSLHLPDDKRCGAPLHMFIGHFSIYLFEVSV